MTAASLVDVEVALRNQEEDEGRKALRLWLMERVALEGTDESLGAIVAELSRTQPSDRDAAVVILRFLPTPIIPDPTAANALGRSVTTLAEQALPDIVSFLRIDAKAQTYEKFEILKACHERVAEILSPLVEKYGDLAAILAGRRNIIGAMAHSVVRAYGRPFGLSDLKSLVEVVFGHIDRLSQPDANFLVTFEEYSRALSASIEAADANGSFLSRDFVRPLFQNISNLLAEYLRLTRERYRARVEWASVGGQHLQKRYPLHEVSREFLLGIPLRNAGPGLALDVRASIISESEAVMLGGQTASLGNVLPGDFSVSFEGIIIEPTRRFECAIEVDWGEIGNPERFSEVHSFAVLAQAGDVDWQRVSYSNPYSTTVAQGDDFVGRADRVQQLASKLLQNPMEPFYVTGQRRVGKTSLVLASAEDARQAMGQAFAYQYILWGEVSHSDPSRALQQLGDRIEQFVRDAVDLELPPLRGAFDGTLAPLIMLVDAANKLAPDQKFLLILDEFDDIPRELFLHGSLAETLFSNLRALSRKRNFSIVLVGGENMPFIMERQGQKLNNFSKISLSYYSRTSEWQDFGELVRAPTRKILDWHDDALSEIFNISNGNPYYAKIICAGVLRRAVQERDSDVTMDEVKSAVDGEVSTLGANAFAHLWQDGIPKPLEEREPDISRRSRLLVAAARCMRANRPITGENLKIWRASAALADHEIPAVLNDFARRDVMKDDIDGWTFSLPIFGSWLADVGSEQLLADTLTEELADATLAEENRAHVRSDEVVRLVANWPTYRGRPVGTDDVRAWYQQVDGELNQRLLFKILSRTVFFRESQIRERLGHAHDMLRSEIPPPVFRSRNDTRRDIVITYVDGEGKSGASYASMYAEQNRISAKSLIPADGFSERLSAHRSEHGKESAIVIIDDLAATGKSLRTNVTKFLENNSELINEAKIRILTLVATREAQTRLTKFLARYDEIDIVFRTCELLQPTAFAFPDSGGVWQSKEEEERARSLCRDLGTNIYRQQPFGFGGLGLLVVLPTTVPNNSLPILHSYSRPGATNTWNPLFPRVVN